jgi:sugar-specific transcriptional regulator TrmB
MYEQFLTQAGLTANQAAIYEILLKHGSQKAGKIAQQSPLKRGLVYKVLDELVALNLAEKREDQGKVAEFSARHPLKLKELAQQREQQARDAQQTLEGILPSLSSDFNLISSKPGILFFEGDAGIREVAEDSLTAHTEILSYLDIEALETYAHQLNKEYVAKRRKLKKLKKMLVTNTPYNKKYFEKLGPQVTDVRFLNFPFPSFQTIMQIYDHKISYITLSKTTKIGVIIENASIATMHRAVFEYGWSTAQSTKTMRPSSPSSSSVLASSQTPPKQPLAPSGPSGTPSSPSSPATKSDHTS